MRMVILPGGLATRLRPLTEDTPKSMVPVHGRPFLKHHIDLLKKHDVADIVMCVGRLGEQLEQRFADGSRFGGSPLRSRLTEGLRRGGEERESGVLARNRSPHTGSDLTCRPGTARFAPHDCRLSS